MASLLVTALPASLLLSPYLTGIASAAAAINHRGTSDSELAEWKLQCYQDIDNSGLWDAACTASAADKENCALICISSPYYDSVYDSDPLEEGEIDLRRGRQFKACIHGEFKGEGLTTSTSAAI